MLLPRDFVFRQKATLTFCVHLKFCSRIDSCVHRLKFRDLSRIEIPRRSFNTCDSAFNNNNDDDDNDNDNDNDNNNNK